MALYLVSIVMSLFGASISFISDAVGARHRLQRVRLRASPR